MSFSPLHVTSTDHNYFRTNRTSTQDFELQPLYDPDVEDTDDTDSSSSTTTASVRSGERMNRSRRGGGSSSGKRKGMNSSSSVEFRRGKVGVEGGESSAAQTEHLIARESFSLDHDHDVSKPAAASLMDLSPKDRRNFFLLVLLYFLQGVPMGWRWAQCRSYSSRSSRTAEIGVFTLASYPYSMKLLWSPIAVSAIMLLWLGGQAEKMMEEANTRLYFFTWVFFCLVMLCASRTLRPSDLTAGQFLSNTVFLAFNSADFSNHYFRSTPLKNGLFTLGGYLQFWGWAYLLVTIGLAVLKKEEKTSNRDGIASVYKTMWSVLKLKHIQTFVIIHLISKIGFQANDAVTNLKLLDKGFTQEDMALTVLIDFPFEIALGYYAGKWCAYFPPMKLWMWGFVGRLIAAVLAQITVYIFPKDGVVESWYLLVVIAEHIFSTFAGTVMFVAISAFHAKIADPEIGGTYMTLLATVSNLGGTFPRIFVLKLVDYFTTATCFPPEKPTSTFPSPHRCIDQGGKCVIQQDGYYVTNVLCILIGVVTFWGYIKPAATRLSALPLKSWREYDRI
ncbi:acetyl-coenzyme A transporter 1-domain-containing protein [Tricharina praecox]|uniref:acetyl-coenzyme A transporter 1-domain-containing protein n=1 Tax=Tricharina praecox TaxID=43433 RepID=UPI0022204DF7|nr:acetyl-coenzyme A transporter 1-domain-containing protein [Tricharina praecox]KAI5840583.1 acetyl-coenzyme A transporter 1-domain-containing protein [Tricharina praecox]